MALPGPTLNQTTAEPSLQDLLNLYRKDIFQGLNCHAVGTVQSFDPLKQTATATLNYKKTYYKPDPISGAFGPTLVDYPLLLDCPVISLGGGNALGGALTFPITTGDECLILFNDRDIDNWFSGNSSGGAATARLHSFADAVLLVGLRSLPKVLTTYDSANTVLRHGANAKVILGSSSSQLVYGSSSFTANASGIALSGSQTSLTSGSTAVKADGTTAALTNGSVTVAAQSAKVLISNGTTLNTLLQSLVTDLQTLVTAIGQLSYLPGPGAAVPLIPGATTVASLTSTLTTLGSNIGALLA